MKKSIFRYTLEALGHVQFYSAEEEARLAAAAAAGDAQAHDALVHSMLPLAIRLSRRQFRGRTECEDIVQEVFLAVCQAVNGFRPGNGRLSTYVTQAIQNQMASRARKQGAERRIRRGACSSDGIFNLAARIQTPADAVCDNLEHSRRLKLVCEMANRVLAVEELAVFRRVLDGASSHEIAAEMCCSRQNIERLYGIGLDKIRAAITLVSNSS